VSRAPCWSVELRHDPIESLQIALENWICLDAVLQAFKIGLQFRIPPLRERINHPGLIAFGNDHPPRAQISEVLGNFNLWLAENALEVTNAKRAFAEQMQNPQAGHIAKALVNFDQFQTA
jgi:hypothetical protein